MTTIACNRLGMAYDTQMDDNGIVSNIQKVYKIHGDLIGFAGEVSEGLRFIKWYLENNPNGDDPFDADEFDMNNTSALVLTKSGKILTYEMHLPIQILDDHYAIGSGALAALVAMDQGHSPKSAIEIASRRDSGTGSRAIWVPLCNLPE